MKQRAISKVPKHARKVFEGVIFDLYQWDQELYDGTHATFEMASRANAVGIIPIVDNKLVIIHEEQPGRPANTGFPGGHIEGGEDPLVAAKRELLEETGMEFENLKLVMIEDIGSHKVDWWCYRYIATGLKKRGPLKPDPGEKIEVEVVDFNTAKKLSKNNIYMANRIMQNVASIQDLLDMPAYKD